MVKETRRKLRAKFRAVESHYWQKQRKNAKPPLAFCEKVTNEHGDTRTFVAFLCEKTPEMCATLYLDVDLPDCSLAKVIGNESYIICVALVTSKITELSIVRTEKLGECYCIAHTARFKLGHTEQLAQYQTIPGKLADFAWCVKAPPYVDDYDLFVASITKFVEPLLA